jgi:hypothetical protein
VPITVTDHTADERAKRRDDLIAQSRRETLRTITLPVGRPRRQIEVVRVAEMVADTNELGTVVRRVVRYELAGDLELFGVAEPWDTIPLHAADDADACRMGEEMVRARWVREG